MERKNATYAFLGEEHQRAAASVELSDVQGLWGGRRIYVAGTAQVVVRLIQPGMLERRYKFELHTDEWNQLLDLLVEKDFLTIRPSERNGIPDEARPRIELVNATGDHWTVSKWAGVKDERFDAVYSALRQLETFTVRLEPVYSGPYQHDADQKLS